MSQAFRHDALCRARLSRACRTRNTAAWARFFVRFAFERLNKEAARARAAAMNGGSGGAKAARRLMQEMQAACAMTSRNRHRPRRRPHF